MYKNLWPYGHRMWPLLVASKVKLFPRGLFQSRKHICKFSVCLHEGPFIFQFAFMFFYPHPRICFVLFFFIWERRERGRGRERIDWREKHRSAASHTHPDWESNLQPFRVAWPTWLGAPSSFYTASSIWLPFWTFSDSLCFFWRQSKWNFTQMGLTPVFFIIDVFSISFLSLSSIFLGSVAKVPH